jgi:hypothetical protein
MMNKWATRLLLVGIVVFAVIVVIIALPGKKSPVRPRHTPTPTVATTSALPHGGSYCAIHGQERAAKDGHTYTCTHYSDGKWRWKRSD